MAPLHRLFRTTTFRLSVLYFVCFGAAAALSISYIYWQTNVLLSAQLQQTVDAEIKGLAEQYSQGGLSRLASTVGERSLTPGDSLYLLTDRSGRRISGNLNKVSAKLWNTVGPVEFTYRRPGAGGVEQRVGYANIFRLQGGYRLIVGRDLEGRRAFERVIRSAFLWGLGSMLLAGIGIGWFVSRNLLARVNAVTAASRTIMEGDLSERIPVDGSGDEMDRLSRNLNDMLDRIENLMLGLREVSDNIAHDLKTPLTRLRNRVEGALREKGSADSSDGGFSREGIYKVALEQTIEEADELIKTFNALLSIARLEAGAARQRMEEIDLSSAVLDVVELYEPVCEEDGVELTSSTVDGLGVFGDRQLIGQAIANLIENSLKYGCRGEGALVSVEVLRSGDMAQICVSDNGPGIVEQDRERVFKRFVRLEKSRSAPGSGLGLSLVAAVCRLHEGRSYLEDNNPGLKVVIELPLISR